MDSSGTIKDTDYNNCCTGPPFCSEMSNLCITHNGYADIEQRSSTARCATQDCDNDLDLQACCSEWNCRVPTSQEAPGYQVTLPGTSGIPSEVPYSQVNQLNIQCSSEYIPSGSSDPSASVCSGNGLNIQLSGCTTGWCSRSYISRRRRSRGMVCWGWRNGPK